MANETDLRAWRAIALTETAPQRREKERSSRMRIDGRSNKTRQASVRFTTDLTPEIKAKLVLLCRRHDIRMRDFVEECLEAGFAKYDGEAP